MLFHVSNRFTHTEKGAAHIRGKYFVPGLRCRILDAPPWIDRCIIDQHIDAPVDFDRPRDERAAFCLDTHVSPLKYGPPAFLLNAGGNGRSVHLVFIRNHHRSAFDCKQSRDPLAHPRGGAGNYGNAIL